MNRGPVRFETPAKAGALHSRSTLRPVYRGYGCSAGRLWLFFFFRKFMAARGRKEERI